MFSFPSSTHSSILSDKQNMNPNGIKAKQAKGTPAEKDRPDRLESGRSEQFISVYQSIGDHKNEVSDNSMKTLLQGFCSTIQQTQQNSQTDSFKYHLTKMLNKEQISLKQFIIHCLNSEITSKCQMMNVVRNPSFLQVTNISRNFSSNKSSTFSCSLAKSVRRALRTELGQLMIQDLCKTLSSSRPISSFQEQVLSIIMPADQEDLSPQSVLQYFSLFKEERCMEEVQVQNLVEQFKVIYCNKLKPKLWSDHFRLQLSNNLNTLQQNEKLSYRSLYKCMGNFLTQKQITTLFRYFYYLQTNLSMPIVDISKRLGLKSVKQSLLGELDKNFEFEKRSRLHDNEEKNRMLEMLEEQNIRQKQMILKRDRKIEQLIQRLEMMELEKQQNEKMLKSNLQLQLEGCRKKYERKIRSIEEQYAEQVKTTQWYQTELQSIINALNKENVMRKFLQ